MTVTGIVREVSRDSVGRAWIRCPNCGRKTPAWTGAGPTARSGWCRWCDEHWVLAEGVQ